MEFKTLGQAKKETRLSYLGSINSSAKIIKNQIVSNNYTYIIYFAPSNQSGYNVCPHSTNECRLGCLNTSGRAKMELNGDCVKKIQNARIKKTKLIVENEEFLMNWLIAEMTLAQKKSIRDNYNFSARLNGTSDIDWSKIKLNNKNIFEIFPDVRFYDYTKEFSRFINKSNNYGLTFSFSGYNLKNCIKVLNMNENVAIVFNVKNESELPKKFIGYDVINGDLTDARFLDKKGCIIGLKWKNIANKTNNEIIRNSAFVIQPNDIRCEY